MLCDVTGMTVLSRSAVYALMAELLGRGESGPTLSPAMVEDRTEHGRGRVDAFPLIANLVSFERIGTSLNSPRQRVIQSAPLRNSPNHIPPARSAHRIVQCLLDRSRLRQEAGGLYCAARSAGSDPPETCGFAAQSVFLRHTPRAGRSRQEMSLGGKAAPSESGRTVASRDGDDALQVGREPNDGSKALAGCGRWQGVEGSAASLASPICSTLGMLARGS